MQCDVDQCIRIGKSCLTCEYTPKGVVNIAKYMRELLEKETDRYNTSKTQLESIKFIKKENSKIFCSNAKYLDDIESFINNELTYLLNMTK